MPVEVVAIERESTQPGQLTRHRTKGVIQFPSAVFDRLRLAYVRPTVEEGFGRVVVIGSEYDSITRRGSFREISDSGPAAGLKPILTRMKSTGSRKSGESPK